MKGCVAVIKTLRDGDPVESTNQSGQKQALVGGYFSAVAAGTFRDQLEAREGRVSSQK